MSDEKNEEVVDQAAQEETEKKSEKTAPKDEKKAKKEKMGEFKPEDILFVVQADLDFAESLDDEDEE